MARASLIETAMPWIDKEAGLGPSFCYYVYSIYYEI